MEDVIERLANSRFGRLGSVVLADVLRH